MLCYVLCRTLCLMLYIILLYIKAIIVSLHTLYDLQTKHFLLHILMSRNPTHSDWFTVQAVVKWSFKSKLSLEFVTELLQFNLFMFSFDQYIKLLVKQPVFHFTWYFCKLRWSACEIKNNKSKSLVLFVTHLYLFLNIHS